MSFFNIAAQNYRNPKAYINDFGKSELFVKEALMEYSKSIIESSPDDRIQTTMERIYIKLEDINNNLLKNDTGINGDTTLRDEFIKLNSKTILLLKNKALKLNDYIVQSNSDYEDIFKNFSYKEKEITVYYSDILYYEKFKKEFGLKYNILIRNYTSKNVFEYNAYQNLIFYKLNVLDDKLVTLFTLKDTEKVNECIIHMDNILKESEFKTREFKGEFDDESLNNITTELIYFFQNQNVYLKELYYKYIEEYLTFQEAKKNVTENDDEKTIAEYNEKVRKFNKSKNDFFDSLYENQIAKRDLINRWYKTNSLFLKNNIVFEDIYDNFIKQKDK
ncbi:hypothetical protein GCM10022389_27820 [Flavobacterium cheonanense]|uniref:Uncharacterized protein n=1 Tax=Flavobacterium cheonanense TaxID=706183 RepID=A0ABP7W5C8_9FLAO